VRVIGEAAKIQVAANGGVTGQESVPTEMLSAGLLWLMFTAMSG